MKRPATVLKELRVRLRYAQEQVRLALFSLRQAQAAVRAIAAEMRKVQQGGGTSS